jgi:hypothetical protein
MKRMMFMSLKNNKYKIMLFLLALIMFTGSCAKNSGIPANYGELIKSAAYTEKEESDPSENIVLGTIAFTQPAQTEAPPAPTAAETQETAADPQKETAPAIITEAPTDPPTESTTEPPYVITPSGKKYHFPTCRTAKNVKQHVSKEEAESMGYTPCGICKPK